MRNNTVKITKRQLRRIIKEEKAKLIAETKVRKLVRRKLSENVGLAAHSQLQYGDSQFGDYDSLVTVHDESGNQIDSWKIHLPPNYHDEGPEGWVAQGKPRTDMADFISWAQGHNLFNLPAYIDEWDNEAHEFEDVVRDGLSGDHGNPYEYPGDTPGA
jgi:hypothetical protein